MKEIIPFLCIFILNPTSSSVAEKQHIFQEFPKTCNSLLNVTLMGCKAVKRNKIKSLEFAQSLKWPLKYSTFHEHDRLKEMMIVYIKRYPLPNRMFFFVNGPWPPLLGFTQSCCGFFDINVKKCVNVSRDKIWHNSAKICGQNVKFTLKLC